MSKTVSGELITIDDSAYDGFKGMTVYGNTVQNLWVNPLEESNSGVTLTHNPDGTFTLSGTANNQEIWFYATIYALKPNTQYTLSCSADWDPRVTVRIQENYDGGFDLHDVLSSRNSFTFTTRSNATRTQCVVSMQSNGSTASGTYRVMLNEGSKAEPWCPPGLNSVGDGGSVKIVTAGKNLFGSRDEAITKNGITVTPNGDGSYTVNGTATNIVQIAFLGSIANPIAIPDGDFVLSGGTQNAKCAAWFYGANRAYIDWCPSSSDSDTRPTETIQKNARYYVTLVEVSSGKTVSNEVIRPMMRRYGTSSDFEIYGAITTTTIDLQGHTLNSLPDGTRDELHIDGGGNVVLEKRTGTYIANGDERWELSATSDAPYRMKVDYWSRDAENDLLPIDRFQVYRLPKYGATPTANNFVVVNGRYQLYAARDGIQDASAFSGWLKSNPMTLIYKLAEPQTIDLGKIDPPKLRKKPLVNNVWTNCRDTTTSFYLDTEMELTYRQWPGVRADGFKVSGKHNFWDFESCVASSDSGKPEKKFVTATVPYMSGFYDLSKIYGAIAYESRDVSYTFELLGDDMEDLQRQKTNLLDWLGLVHDEPIYDDTQPNYHYVGSFYEADWEEDETGESGTLTVTFKCQPFLIADRATEESLSVGTHTVVNNGQQVSVFAKANSGSATVKINGVIQAVTTTEQRLTAQLQPGENEVVVTSNSVTLRYYERHL